MQKFNVLCEKPPIMDAKFITLHVIEPFDPTERQSFNIDNIMINFGRKLVSVVNRFIYKTLSKTLRHNTLICTKSLFFDDRRRICKNGCASWQWIGKLQDR